MMYKLIKSPLNYTGGKFKLLPQILPLFPKNINTFVDLFCGGGDVGSNIQCEHVYFNDINQNVLGILNAFHSLEKEDSLQFIRETIQNYNLSDTNTNGYAFYGCDSSNGLGNYNRKSFSQLKEYFNNLQQRDYYYYLLLYTLIVYSFNNQIRFNKRGEFNLPVGKRDFNAKMQKKLNSFIDRLKEIKCHFSSVDFRQIDINQLNINDFVYVDPPYLITCATYNEQGGWNEDFEHALYNYLDELNAHDIRFALSNVLKSKGKVNIILQEWLAQNPHLSCHHLNYNYSNSNYHTTDRLTGSDEILITNY